MPEFVFVIGCVLAALACGAWHEYRKEQRREAALVGSFAAGGSLMGAIAWVAA